MKERSSPLAEAAERCGVSRRTLKDWIRKAGYNLPPRQSKGRYTILIPDWMVQKLIDDRSPRIARVSGVRTMVCRNRYGDTPKTVDEPSGVPSGKEVRSSAHAGSSPR
jgi:hypothetical protein